MPRTVYDKTTCAQLKDMLESRNLQPEEGFITARALQSFAVNSPKLKAGVIVHLVQAPTNDPSRLPHLLTNSLTIFCSRSPLRGGQYHEASTDSAPICELVKFDIAQHELVKAKSYRNKSDDTTLVDSACSRMMGNGSFITNFRLPQAKAQHVHLEDTQPYSLVVSLFAEL